MRFLLDSAALVHWINRGRFDRAVRRRIERMGALVSAASGYELANKQRLGKLRLPIPVSEAIDEYGFQALPISVAHAERAAALPSHHRDPFDRILIAQGQIGALTIVTRDAAFSAYDVDVVAF
jgi:PIN domain nuclease of toxin-antitoxin system